MEMKKFIENFADQFDEIKENEITPSTEFKGIAEWSSLQALSVIAMCDEEYEVEIKGDDIRNATTIEDLYNIVKSRAK